MAQIIPLRNDRYKYEMNCSLDGRLWGLEFSYNRRADLWILQVYDVETMLAKAYLPLLSGALLSNHRMFDVPEGEFYLKDVLYPDHPEEPTGLELMGERWVLYYDPLD